MAIQFAPGAENSNPLGALVAALAASKGGASDDSDLSRELQKFMVMNGLKDAGDTSPVQSPWQGAARMSNSLVNALMMRKLIGEDKAHNSAMTGAISGMIDGGGSAAPTSSPMPAPTPNPAPSAPMPIAPQMSNTAPGSNAMAQAPGGNPGLDNLVKSLMNPAPVADTPAPLSGGNPAQGIDRSRIKSELDADPALMRKYADMTFGEVRGQGPGAAQIQAETAADRALGRNIPLAQALMAVNDPNARQGGKNLGYYASDTYKRPANPQELAQFQNDILPKVLGGSEQGMNALGFRPTGNASGQFAQDRAARGIYDNSGWLSGKPGVGEMYATEKGDTARMAQNLKSLFPSALMNPNMDPGSAQSFAPVQVASNDGLAGIPQQQQAPAVGSFTPGSLPNVPTAAVHPTGPMDGPQAAPQQMPQQAMPQPQAQQQPQQQFAQPQRATPQVPPNVAQAAKGLLAIGTKDARDAALKLVAPYMQPQQYQFKDTGDGTMLRMNPATGSAEPVYQSSKPSFVVIGKDRNAQDVHGFVDPTTKKVYDLQGNPIGPQSGLAGMGGGDTSTTGDEFMKTLPVDRQNLIKGMIEGRIAPAQMGRYGTAQVQSLLNDAARAEPGFDLTKWSGRVNTTKDFASGAAAKNVTALNTVIGHLNDLADKSDALHNVNSGFGPLNTTVNSVKNQYNSASGAPEMRNFDLARNAVADEMAKVFRGSGLSDAETRQWKDNLNSAMTPDQLHGAVSTAVGLMESRLAAMEDQRRRGMSTDKDLPPLINQKAQESLARVKAWASGQQQQPAQSAPAQGGLPQGWSVQVH